MYVGLLVKKLSLASTYLTSPSQGVDGSLPLPWVHPTANKSAALPMGHAAC